MLRKFLIIAVLLSIPTGAMAHLCNDVFVQARDNLAVKVDVRDGQLRIGKTASFRVYLLNTMDRDIVDIRLEIKTSGKFVAVVKPSPSWKHAPRLRTVRSRGKRKAKGRKQYYEVTLTRKPGVPDGKYPLKLHLFNGKNSKMVFKTVDLSEAAGCIEVPKAGSVKIDGNATSSEWGKGKCCLISKFGEFKKTKLSWNSPRGVKTMNKFDGRVPCRDMAVVRFSADKDNLYICAQLQGKSTKDILTFYAAKGLDDKPVTVKIDRLTGQATCSAGQKSVTCKVSPNKQIIEVKIPRALLNLSTAKTFRGNFTRTTANGGKPVTSYWRGTPSSAENPVEYADFKLPG